MTATHAGYVLPSGKCFNGPMASSPRLNPIPGDMGAGLVSRTAEIQVKELVPGAAEDAMDLGLNLVRASSAYVQMSEAKVLRTHDLRWASFSVLFMTYLFPGIEARTISKLTGVTRQATSQVLATLEKADRIVRRQSDSTDKRLMEVRLTDRGLEALREAMAAHLDASTQWFDRITTEEQRELNRLLKKVLGG
jgi:MarR family transcriptional regulator, organic hydroperoxide resistance regulator